MCLKIRKYGTAGCLTGLFCILWGMGIFHPEQKIEQQIFINEVCSQNRTIRRDSNRDYTDYIELYNGSDVQISLAGWHLSDDKDLPEKAELSGLGIAPKGYLVLHANGDDDSLPFKIGAGGAKRFS